MSDAAAARDSLAKVLEFPQSSDLGNTYEQLRLIGAVLGQVALLEVASGGGKDSDRVSAAKALIKLGERPEEVAERLKAGVFAGLDTKDLHHVVKLVQDGWSPKNALEEVRQQKESA